MKLITSLLFLLVSPTLFAQQNSSTSTEELPYRQIPAYPEKYNACTVAARLIDGLGFRYYWATEGLREEDLSFRPGKDARTINQTLDHIRGLVSVVLNSVKQQPNIRPEPKVVLSFAEKRRETLLALQEASDILRASKPKKMKDFQVIFQRGERRTEYPFWNQLNGPIADALWHVGQIVSFRRSAGNPLHPKVSVFQGKLRE